MEYRRALSVGLFDSIFIPSFLVSAPERNPRTECACQPVAFINSAKVAPLDFSSSAMTFAVLLPRAVAVFVSRLGGFLAVLEVLPASGFRFPPRCFLDGVGVSDAVCDVVWSCVSVVMADFFLSW